MTSELLFCFQSKTVQVPSCHAGKITYMHCDVCTTTVLSVMGAPYCFPQPTFCYFNSYCSCPALSTACSEHSAWIGSCGRREEAALISWGYGCRGSERALGWLWAKDYWDFSEDVKERHFSGMGCRTIPVVSACNLLKAFIPHIKKRLLYGEELKQCNFINLFEMRHVVYASVVMSTVKTC